MIHWTQIIALVALIFMLCLLLAFGNIRDALEFLLALAIIVLLGAAAVGAFAP